MARSHAVGISTALAGTFIYDCRSNLRDTATQAESGDTLIYVTTTSAEHADHDATSGPAPSTSQRTAAV